MKHPKNHELLTMRCATLKILSCNILYPFNDGALLPRLATSARLQTIH